MLLAKGRWPMTSTKRAFGYMTASTKSHRDFHSSTGIPPAGAL